MKKLYYYLIIVITTVSFQACDSNFLEETPRTFLSPATTYKSDAGLSAGAVGLYDVFARRFTADNYLWHVQATMDMSTDIMRTGTGINPMRAFALLSADYTSLNGTVAATWKYFYEIATNAALIIDKAEDHEWTDIALREQVLSEAFFYRAWAHFYLALFWGDVPMINKSIEGVKLDFVRTPKGDVMKLVIDDLIKAEAGLGYDDYKNQWGRINKGIVQHFLAYVYLANKDWVNSEKYAKLVINSGKYALMQIRFGAKKDDLNGNVFWDLFQYGNQSPGAGNKEGIWVWQNDIITGYPAVASAGGPLSSARMPRTMINAYYQYNGILAGVEYGGRGVGIVSATEYWLDNFETNDTRGQMPNVQKVIKINDPRNANFGVTVMDWNHKELYDYENIRLRPHATKWNWEGINSDNSTTERNIYMFRLSETYLILAEAQMMQNKPGEAVANINIVRKRAGASEVQANQVTIDFILEERARELFGEVSRRADLVRTDKYVERTRLYNEQCGTAVEDKFKLLPLPQAQIDLNTENPLTNNPGW